MVIFVSACEDSLMFAVCEPFGIPKRGTSLNHRVMSETLSLFLGADYLVIRMSGDPPAVQIETRMSGDPAVQSDKLSRLSTITRSVIFNMLQ